MMYLAHIWFCFSAPPNSGCSDLGWLQDSEDILLCLAFIFFLMYIMFLILADVYRKPRQ